MKRILIASFFLLLSGFCQAKLAVGDAAPIRLGKHSKTGEEVILPEYTGKITVVHFWADWCDYCYKTLPALEAMQEQLGQNNLQVISVAVKNTALAVNKITNEMKNMLMVSSIDKTGKVMGSFGDEYMPNVWIIDRNGKILAQTAIKDDEDLKKAIRLVESALRAK